MDSSLPKTLSASTSFKPAVCISLQLLKLYVQLFFLGLINNNKPKQEKKLSNRVVFFRKMLGGDMYNVRIGK